MDKIYACVSNIADDYVDILKKRYTFTSNFMPCNYEDDNLAKPIYCHVSSKTGRVKIVDGYNFLVMKASLKGVTKIHGWLPITC